MRRHHDLASCRSRTLRGTTYRPRTRTRHIRASCCLPIRRCIYDHRPRCRCLNPPCGSSRIIPQTCFHPSRRNDQDHAFCCPSTSPRRRRRRSMSPCLGRGAGLTATHPHTVPHLCECRCPTRASGRPSSIPSKRLRPSE